MAPANRRQWVLKRTNSRKSPDQGLDRKSIRGLTVDDMKKNFTLFTMAVALLVSSTADAAPEVGDKAPKFSLKGSDGKTYSTADYKGKQAMVIAWYPKAFTGG